VEYVITLNSGSTTSFKCRGLAMNYVQSLMEQKIAFTFEYK
jgi:threonine dehydratase